MVTLKNDNDISDVCTSKMRSYNMSRIRGKDTKPEIQVRKALFAKGFRFRKNVKKLPGSPDIVLPKYKTVVFVNGCFWHMHSCDLFVWPKTNVDFWHRKIEGNALRDANNSKRLKEMGWTVVVVWECELKKDFEGTIENLVHVLEPKAGIQNKQIKDR